ncbi:MAG: flagellar biosynthesis protein FlhF [Desulfuromonadaceae bacterium GWC2_58_13]|nr:MAG: flagellar biosynthesis protein FlhF [Desulfuromonadaceae bacterium GWC2_58_13]
MQVKVFEAPDMATALRMIKETLGPDALILSTRSVRKGRTGLLGKPVLEVTAAIESPEPAPVSSGVSQSAVASLYARTVVEEPTCEPVAAESEVNNYGDLWRRRRVIDPLEEELDALKGKVSALNVDSLRNEISELKELVKGAVRGNLETKPSTPRAGQSAITRMMNALLSRGVHEGPAEMIVRRALQNYPPKTKSISIEGFLAAAIVDLIRVGRSLNVAQDKPRAVALIGPTGVGKTTTVAKLAADYLLNQKRKIALVTIDIYRIAAAEQLKVYGEIMQVPVDVVLSPEQLQQVLARHQDKDLILIDTAGRSPRDSAGIAELQKFIGAGSGIENHLVLSATTREQEMFGAIKRFGRLPVSSLIFSKLDECEGLGSILNVHLKHDCPISYLTNGQRVPEDLMLADPRRVAGLVMGKLKE